MTYEYECMDCGHLWELEQKISEEPSKVCPKCKKKKAKRLISDSIGGFALKGGRWAKSGYS